MPARELPLALRPGDQTPLAQRLGTTVRIPPPTKGDAHGDKWHSLRLLHKEDGMGVTLTDSILEEGFEMVLCQKNHLEAC